MWLHAYVHSYCNISCGQPSHECLFNLCTFIVSVFWMHDLRGKGTCYLFGREERMLQVEKKVMNSSNIHFDCNLTLCSLEMWIENAKSYFYCYAFAIDISVMWLRLTVLHCFVTHVAWIRKHFFTPSVSILVGHRAVL